MQNTMMKEIVENNIYENKVKSLEMWVERKRNKQIVQAILQYVNKQRKMKVWIHSKRKKF